MSERTVQEAFARACLEDGADAEIAADPAGFLRARGVSEEEIGELGEGVRRFSIYRQLVRNNLKDVTYNLLEGTRGRLGERFDRDFSAFLSERGPSSAFLRDLPFEFLDWVLPRWAADVTVPAWAADSARHELAIFATGAAPHVPEPPTLLDLALDRPVALSGAVRLESLAHTVHLPGDAPEPRAVLLLVHRDATYTVRVLELTPLAYAFTEQLLRGTHLKDAMLAACTTLGQALDDETLASFATLLADFGERGIILGALP